MKYPIYTINVIIPTPCSYLKLKLEWNIQSFLLFHELFLCFNTTRVTFHISSFFSYSSIFMLEILHQASLNHVVFNFCLDLHLGTAVRMSILLYFI